MLVEVVHSKRDRHRATSSSASREESTGSEKRASRFNVCREKKKSRTSAAKTSAALAATRLLLS